MKRFAIATAVLAGLLTAGFAVGTITTSVLRVKTTGFEQRLSS